MNKFLSTSLQLLRPTDNLDKFMIFVFLVLFMLNLGHAPIGGENGVEYIAWIVIASMLILAFRNIYLAGFILFALNIAFRFKNQISHFADLVFVQNYGISSILNGINIYSSNNLGEHSFSYYLPMGSLFGSLPIYLGLDNYWNFYHVLVPILLLIPFIHKPTIFNLSIFVITSYFFPLVDYTTGGGNVELSYAFLIPGLYLLINDRGTLSAIVLLSFGIMLRQPNVFLIPFVLIVLIRERQKEYIWGFLLLLFLAGGWYILQDISGFLQSNFTNNTTYQEIWYKRSGGLMTNFSISTVLQYIGFNNTWYIENRFYVLGTLIVNLSITVVASIAYFRNSIDLKSYIALGLLTVLFVYVLSRGMAYIHYLMGGCFLFWSLFYNSSTHTDHTFSIDEGNALYGKNNVANLFTKIIAGVVFILILFPLLIVLTHSPKKVGTNNLNALYFLEQNDTTSQIPLSFSTDRSSINIEVGGSVVIALEKPAYVENVTLIGERFVPRNIEGIEINRHPSPNQLSGFIRRGVLLGSKDGINYHKINDIDNVINYHVYPVQLPVRENVQYLKIKIDKAYDRSKVVTLGNISISSN